MELNSFSLKKSTTNTDHDKIAGLYNIGNTIGKGHYAVVKEAKHAFTGEKVAIKVIDKTKLDMQSREHLFSEVMCMKLVQHPNVVRLYEVIDTAHKLYLVLELGDGGDLYDYIMKFENGLPELKAKRYFRQIVQAIAYCHNLHVVHRDLKPENVVFFEKVELVKLTDFGFSNKFTPGKTLDTSCGSLAYSAPEILLGDAYDAPKIDIWSLGVLLFMLVVGQLPFEEANDSETLSRIMDCRYELPARVSSSCRHLIGRMLVRDPEKRASLEEILSDDWLEYEDESNFELDSFSVPLISQEHLTVEEHVEILSKMSEGNLAGVEDIQLILDSNEFSYISATYFLLAERKLKRRYFERYYRMKLLEIEREPPPAMLTDVSSTDSQLLDQSVTQTEPSIPETSEDRMRRFSMILEDEEDEAEEEELAAMISLASVREELEQTAPPPIEPYLSRCASRLSDAIELDAPPTDSIEMNSRFSAFRQQFSTRSRCRSAIYSSHSLSSLPHAAPQLLIDTSVYSPSKFSRLTPLLSPAVSSSIGPRFQRNFSGTFQRRQNFSFSSHERSFDDNFHCFPSFAAATAAGSNLTSTAINRQRVSLPTATGTKKRLSFPALFSPSGGGVGTLSHSLSSSDVSSDNELSLLRGFNERKKVRVPKSFGQSASSHRFCANSATTAAMTTMKLAPTMKPDPLLMLSTSSIDSDSSFAAPNRFSQAANNNRRLRIKTGTRSRPSSMGATMSAVVFEDFQSLCGVSEMICEENCCALGNVADARALSGSPTAAAVHRDICAPIHEEEELIRSRSYIDSDTSTDNRLSAGRHAAVLGAAHRSVSVDCRRKSDSIEGAQTTTKWQLPQQSNRGGAIALQSAQKRAPISSAPLQRLDSHSLSSQLSQSNFSLSSFASSLRDSKAMMNLVRGAFELQCLANRLSKTGSSPSTAGHRHGLLQHHSNHHRDHRLYQSDVCASATVSGRESRCEYASVTSLPLGGHSGHSGHSNGNGKLLHSPDDSESLLVGRGANRDAAADGGGGSDVGEHCGVAVEPAAVRKNGMTLQQQQQQKRQQQQKKNNNKSMMISEQYAPVAMAVSTATALTGSNNPFIRAGSNMGRKARFILSCCRPS